MRFWERGYGEIGRHARFRFWCRKAWEFKSLYPHQGSFVAGGGLRKSALEDCDKTRHFAFRKMLENCMKATPGRRSGVVLIETNGWLGTAATK